MWIKPPSKSLKILRSIRWILCNVKETFFKKLGRKIWRFSMHVKHKSLIFVMKKKPVNNSMFEIDIKNTRTRCEICSKITIKTPKLFFYCWLWKFICLLNSYLHFYCLNDFHYLDHFHCLHDLQKNWNLMYILKLA